MMIKTKFDLQQIVYLKTDPEQLPRMVTGISVRSTGLVYALSSGADESTHYDFEISEEKDVLAELY